MSVCTFIASDYPLREAVPEQKYPIEINIDTGTIYDGGMDDNYFLFSFPDVSDYTNKKYGVYLEWDYTNGRAERILEYIKEALEKTEVIELWHVWLGDYYEYEDSPVIHKRTLRIDGMTVRDIYELDNADIWNHPDKCLPSRPSFYRLIITK